MQLGDPRIVSGVCRKQDADSTESVVLIELARCHHQIYRGKGTKRGAGLHNLCAERTEVHLSRNAGWHGCHSLSKKIVADMPGTGESERRILVDEQGHHTGSVFVQ